MAKKAAKRKSRIKTTRVWVARNNHPNSQSYSIYRNEPKPHDEYWEEVKDGDFIEGGLCPKWFHRMTGIVLKPGTCKQFDLRIEAVPVAK